MQAGSRETIETDEMSTNFIYKRQGPWYYEQHQLGYNFRISEIQAALGTSQVKKLNYFVKKRNHIAKIYIKTGDKVVKGENLLVIEAMKMETTITADKSATIKSLYVETGDNVETKDLLIELE